MESATARAGSASASDRSERRGTIRRLSTETKQAFKTTEFWAMVVVNRREALSACGSVD